MHTFSGSWTVINEVYLSQTCKHVWTLNLYSRGRPFHVTKHVEDSFLEGSTIPRDKTLARVPLSSQPCRKEVSLPGHTMRKLTSRDGCDNHTSTTALLQTWFGVYMIISFSWPSFSHFFRGEASRWQICDLDVFRLVRVLVTNCLRNDETSISWSWKT